MPYLAEGAERVCTQPGQRGVQRHPAQVAHAQQLRGAELCLVAHLPAPEHTSITCGPLSISLRRGKPCKQRQALSAEQHVTAMCASAGKDCYSSKAVGLARIGGLRQHMKSMVGGGCRGATPWGRRGCSSRGSAKAGRGAPHRRPRPTQARAARSRGPGPAWTGQGPRRSRRC